MSIWKGIIGKGFTADDFDSYVQGLTLKWNPADFHPEFIVLHNTAAPTLAQWPKVSGEQHMQNFQHYYRDIQKWSAGPHLFIASDLIWAFTPLDCRGVHSPSWNGISWGVEMVGNYDIEQIPQTLWENTLRALLALHRKMNFQSAELRLHREDPLTTHKNCPGLHVAQRKQAIVSYLNAALAPAVTSVLEDTPQRATVIQNLLT